MQPCVRKIQVSNHNIQPRDRKIQLHDRKIQLSDRKIQSTARKIQPRDRKELFWFVQREIMVGLFGFRAENREVEADLGNSFRVQTSV